MSPSLTADQQELRDQRLRRNLKLSELLLQATPGGSGEAYGEFYDLTLGTVRRYVRYRITDAAAAARCVDLAYLTALKQTFDCEHDAAEAWILRAARTVVIDWFRDRGQSSSFALVAEARNAEERVLIDAIQSLPSATQECLTLYFMLELDAELISYITGIPFAGVNALLLTAMRSLRKKISGRPR